MRELLQRSPVIPVLTIEDVAHAVPLAQALVAGGLTVLEVTLRTPAALASIRAMRAAVPAAVVGAGTVVNSAQYAAAVEAGSQFVVSPGCSPALIAASGSHGVPLLPGATTPTEIIAALDAGIDTLKFFPAAQSGGVAMLKALSAPLPQVAFCPTGGITMANAKDYLALPNVLCVGMSSIVTKEWLASGNWEAIRDAAAAAAALRSHA
ncbi:MAG: bifunctional 4-hydroxy-2-oxoglutarate aldolase/2-dehydro-3-deoxy-phosphogluconate aldolase [Gammaproteobacteria bacterium]|nr:bifunctional 4-hydroxy-2-oxoglutarate aldolase/2-dehydro-3-deoxy-phosphogluconate aldolase [Gammaproteobacteria bacterium]